MEIRGERPNGRPAIARRSVSPLLVQSLHDALMDDYSAITVEHGRSVVSSACAHDEMK